MSLHSPAGFANLHFQGGYVNIIISYSIKYIWVSLKIMEEKPNNQRNSKSPPKLHQDSKMIQKRFQFGSKIGIKDEKDSILIGIKNASKIPIKKGPKLVLEQSWEPIPLRQGYGDSSMTFTVV